MIYTRFGSEIKIIADHGAHKTKGFKYRIRLVTIAYASDGLEHFEFLFTLRATGGADEIWAAVTAAPKVNLDAAALFNAQEQAL